MTAADFESYFSHTLGSKTQEQRIQEVVKYIEDMTGCAVEVDGDVFILHPKNDITFIKTTTTIKGEL